jgi:hypothetical protein
MTTRGRKLRDAGRLTVAKNAHPVWRDTYRKCAWTIYMNLPPGAVFDSDTIRSKVHMDPHHPNAWSAAWASFLAELRRHSYPVREIAPETSKRPSRHASLTRRYHKSRPIDRSKL